MERGFVNKEWFKFEKRMLFLILFIRACYVLATAQSPDNPIALAVLFGLADVCSLKECSISILGREICSFKFSSNSLTHNYSSCDIFWLVGNIENRLEYD